MQIWKKNIDSTDMNSSALVMLNAGDSMFLDIETTGLSPKYHHCYLIGCCFADGGQVILQQFFCEDVTEEKEMLEHFTAFSNNFQQTITFNGCHFDIPFLEKRCSYHGLRSPFTDFIHIDIYRECQALKKTLGLLSCSQKSVEQYLGISREDQFSGRELISVYTSYEKKPDAQKLHLLKLHNFEDVLGMTALTSILSYRKIPEKVQADQISDLDNEIIVSGEIGTVLPRPLRLRSNFCYCILDSNTFRFSVRLENGPLKYFIKDYKKYDYLKSEKRIIPKSLSKQVDPAEKEAATPETCFLEKNGRFLPVQKHQNVSPETYLFRHSPKDSQAYFLWNQNLCSTDFLSSYICAFFRSFF